MHLPVINPISFYYYLAVSNAPRNLTIRLKCHGRVWVIYIDATRQAVAKRRRIFKFKPNRLRETSRKKHALSVFYAYCLYSKATGQRLSSSPSNIRRTLPSPFVSTRGPAELPHIGFYVGLSNLLLDSSKEESMSPEGKKNLCKVKSALPFHNIWPESIGSIGGLQVVHTGHIKF